MPGEARALAGRRAAQSDETALAHGWLVRAGVGSERARAAAESLVARGAHGLVSFGVAGGLDPALPAGSLVLAEGCVDGRHRMTADPVWRKRLRSNLAAVPEVYAGWLAHSDAPLTGSEDKRALAERTGAVAADMETGAIAAVAMRHGLGWVALRAVADPAGRALPPPVLAAMDASGHARIAPLVQGLLRRPLAMVTLVHLALDYRRALRALRHAGQCVAAELGA